jgi:hypothetical protein
MSEDHSNDCWRVKGQQRCENTLEDGRRGGGQGTASKASGQAESQVLISALFLQGTPVSSYGEDPS